MPSKWEVIKALLQHKKSDAETGINYEPGIFGIAILEATVESEVAFKKTVERTKLAKKALVICTPSLFCGIKGHKTRVKKCIIHNPMHPNDSYSYFTYSKNSSKNTTKTYLGYIALSGLLRMTRMRPNNSPREIGRFHCKNEKWHRMMIRVKGSNQSIILFLKDSHRFNLIVIPVNSICI